MLCEGLYIPFRSPPMRLFLIQSASEWYRTQSSASNLRVYDLITAGSATTSSNITSRRLLTLLAKNCDPNWIHPRTGATFLSAAVSAQNSDAVKHLLKAKSDPNMEALPVDPSFPRQAENPLALAVQTGSVPIVMELLKAGRLLSHFTVSKWSNLT